MVRTEGTAPSDGAQVNNCARSSSDKYTPETESPAANIKSIEKREKKRREESVDVSGIAVERDSKEEEAAAAERLAERGGGGGGGW